MTKFNSLSHITWIMLCLFFTSQSIAQTTLSPGDIMIIGLNAYNSTENEFASEGSADEFMFVLLEPVTSGTVIYFTDFGYIGNTAPFFQTNFNTGACSSVMGQQRGDVSSGLIKWTATSALPSGTKVIIRTGGSSGAGVLATSVGTISTSVASQNAGVAISLTTAGETLHAFQGTLDGNNIPTAVTVITALRYRTSWETPTGQCHYTPSISGNPNTGFDVVHTSNPDNMIYDGPLTGTKSQIQDSIQDLSKWNTTTSNNPFSFSASSAPSQVTMSPNDLVVLQMNTDGGDDEVAFLVLEDISSGSILFISDISWNALADTQGSDVERGIKFTIGSSDILAGTIIRIKNNTSALYELEYPTQGTLEYYELDGSIEVDGSRELTLNTSGDQLIVFQTDDGSVTGDKTFIYALSTYQPLLNDSDSDGWTDSTSALAHIDRDSHIPTGLIALNSTQSNKTTASAMSLGGLSGHFDNWIYTGSTIAATKDEWLTRVHTLSNWNATDSTPPGPYLGTIYDNEELVNNAAVVTMLGAGLPPLVIARTVSFETPIWPDASSGQVEINTASHTDGLYNFSSSTKMFLNGSAASDGIQSFWPTEFAANEKFTIKTTSGAEFDLQEVQALIYDSAAFFASAEGFRNGVSTGTQTSGTGFTIYSSQGTKTITFANSIFDNVDSVVITSSGPFGISLNLYDEFVFQDPTVAPAGPSIAITSSTNPTCNGGANGTIIATTTGGTANYTYAWSNGSSISNTGSIVDSITSLSAGYYKVVVTDNNGLQDSTDITLTQPSAVLASAIVDSNLTCNGASNGGATASATGGTGTYTYLWSNAATTASITGVAAGTYTVTITDANGCSDTSSVTIIEPVVLNAATIVDSNVSCNGFANGGATASATGGTMPYSYIWSNAATTASITGVVAGTYTVTITDANGCSDTSSVTITEPVVLNAASVVDSNVSCNGFANGGATASATGGTMPYSYMWSNSATTASITGVVAGTYTVTITDANGCYDTTSVTITEPAILNAASVVDSNVSCNGFANGGATASATGGTMPYSYMWSNSATTASITGVVAGTYTVTITDANGCYDTTSVTITEPTILNAASVVDSNVSCNGFANGGATASATGGTMPYSYMWSNSATTASITGVVAGTYTVTITDANGCYDTTSVTITEPPVSQSIDTVRATNSYEWMDGVTYTESIYGPTHTLTNMDGCDSVVTLNLTIINYCASRSTRNRYEWIKQVELEDDIDNLSNANSGGYGDYTDQILTVDTGDVISVSLTPGYKRRAYDEYWRIWADWNYDGDFDDAGEKVFEQKGKNVRTGTFTIPTDVDPHDLGLRISMRWKRYAAPCGNYTNGEVEDYTIHVNGAQGYNNPLPTRMAQDEYVDASGGLYEFIDLYPNPVLQGDYVYGYIRVEETGVKHLQIINTLGQVIKSESIVCDEEENRFEVSTQGLAKGIYFINIDAGLETIKIIVQ